ncbi:hypothetical protein DLAC_06957 [Tieghemostelium lacteum]|uniref:Ankyrin repeat-containing protein n=1 Tax=Tieghemostelium lacteum TaxID=361077 RepID=A0A151ZDU8_TIELA|nr:hypothetical protein DLAC_06957 [Tieghemostelium lacteum]|eukprot:KYQ92117.1 hypothetical protein DLAC_06957 [Tieghemostelium lacteum]
MEPVPILTNPQDIISVNPRCIVNNYTEYLYIFTRPFNLRGVTINVTFNANNSIESTVQNVDVRSSIHQYQDMLSMVPPILSTGDYNIGTVVINNFSQPPTNHTIISDCVVQYVLKETSQNHEYSKKIDNYDDNDNNNNNKNNTPHNSNLLSQDTSENEKFDCKSLITEGSYNFQSYLLNLQKSPNAGILADLHPITIGCLAGVLDITKLTKECLNTFQKPKSGINCLHMASEQKKPKIVYELINSQYGSLLQMELDSSGMVPMELSVLMGDTDSVKHYINYSTVISEMLSHRDKLGFNIINLAITFKRYQIIVDLLELQNILKIQIFHEMDIDRVIRLQNKIILSLLYYHQVPLYGFNITDMNIPKKETYNNYLSTLNLKPSLLERKFTIYQNSIFNDCITEWYLNLHLKSTRMALNSTFVILMELAHYLPTSLRINNSTFLPLIVNANVEMDKENRYSISCVVFPSNAFKLGGDCEIFLEDKKPVMFKLIVFKEPDCDLNNFELLFYLTKFDSNNGEKIVVSMKSYKPNELKSVPNDLL